MIYTNSDITSTGTTSSATRPVVYASVATSSSSSTDTSTYYRSFSSGRPRSVKIRYSPPTTSSATWSLTESWDCIDATTSTNWGWSVIRPGGVYWDEEFEFSDNDHWTPEKQAAYDAKVLKQKIQKAMRERCGPNIIIRDNTKRQPLAISSDIREQRARETLRRVVGDSKFLNFVKNGFISVKAKSGLVYQIFTGHGITHVFDQGNLVERLCVVLQGNFPPTDSLIMRYLLILNNEQQFRSFAVKHSVQGHQTKRSRHKQETVIKSLSEIFKELKAKAA